MSELLDKLPNAEHNRAHRARKRRARTGITLFLTVAIVVGAAVVALPHVKNLLHIGTIAAADYEGEGTGEVAITIPAGSTGAEIAEILYGNEVVASQRAFVDAYNNEKRSGSIQAGSYLMRLHMSANAAIAALLDPASKADLAVTIPEGFTKFQVADRLVNVMGFELDDVNAAFEDTDAIELPSEAGGNVEGWLAPGTYSFHREVTPVEAVAEMVRDRVAELRAASISQDKWERTLTVASIVEREVNWPEYYGQVARVIENRLNPDGESRGRLQMDSTALYGVGKSGGVPSKEDLENQNPYNTYVNAGLPAGPISNPSLDTIRASLNPPAGDWLYFVTTNLETGETKFSNNLDEHNRNVAELRDWVAAHPQS